MINISENGQIQRAKDECTETLALSFQGIRFRLHTNNRAVLDNLECYFAGLTMPASAPIEQTIYLLDQEPDIDQTRWTPVKRNKVSPLGLKEAYADAPDGRWIHKVRTGMVMFQSLTEPMVIGHLLENPSQVVNFINNQFLNHYQRQGYVLGHASAFNINGNTTAIAASSGGGKSTLMLKALETELAQFLSNDRVLFQHDGKQTNILGVAKHPRVNPGTLLHSDRLAPILPAEERTRFASLPGKELWGIEQKYDVLIPQHYGDNKVALTGTLNNLVLLDWSLDTSATTELTPVNIHETPHALEGLRKSPGPFFQTSEGQFPPEQSQPLSVYTDNLKGVQVWRLSGKVDFDQAIHQLQERGIL